MPLILIITLSLSLSFAALILGAKYIDKTNHGEPVSFKELALDFGGAVALTLVFLGLIIIGFGLSATQQA